MEQYYNNLIASLQEESAKLQEKVNRISGLRLLLIILLVILIYQGFKFHFVTGIFAIIVSIGGFYYLVKYHERTEVLRDLKITTINLLKNEIGILKGNPNVYADGSEYQDAAHHFSEDLDLFGKFSLFHLINRAKSKSGKDFLARALLNGQSSYSIYEKQAAVKELAGKSAWRLNFLASMFGLTGEEQEISRILEKIEEPPKIRFETFISFYNTLLPFLWAGAGCLAWMVSFEAAGYMISAVFILNYYLVLTNKKQTEQYFNTISGAGRAMEKYGVASSLIVQENWTSEILSDALKKMPVSHLSSKNPVDDFIVILKKLDMRKNIYAALFLYLASPFEPVQLIKLRKWLKNNPDFFTRIFESLGVFESYASMAALHSSKPDWAFPVISEQAVFHLNGQNMGHPLIRGQETVCNDFTLDSSNRLSLVTGSNMSGKSTFLRTIGLNVVLAYCGAPVFATSMDLGKDIKLICYMRIKDSVQQNASTFKAEINRIKLIINAIDSGEKALFLIDEMLRGTNSEDKLTGSMALLEKIASSEAFALVATHDLRMTDIKYTHDGIVGTYYFEYATENGELSFDYKIKPGICQSFNASILLRSIGLEIPESLKP